MAKNWWIDIDLKVSAPTVKVVESRTVQIWEWRKKYQRKSTLRTRTYTESKTLNLASIISEIIANRIANHMIEYAPIDESPHKDDIVLKKNIRATEISDWNFVVWSVLSALPTYIVFEFPICVNVGSTCLGVIFNRILPQSSWSSGSSPFSGIW